MSNSMKSFVPQEDDVDLFSDDEDAKEDQVQQEDTVVQSMDAIPVADMSEKANVPEEDDEDLFSIDSSDDEADLRRSKVDKDSTENNFEQDSDLFSSDSSDDEADLRRSSTSLDISPARLENGSSSMRNEGKSLTSQMKETAQAPLNCNISIESQSPLSNNQEKNSAPELCSVTPPLSTFAPKPGQVMNQEKSKSTIPENDSRSHSISNENSHGTKEISPPPVNDTSSHPHRNRKKVVLTDATKKKRKLVARKTIVSKSRTHQNFCNVGKKVLERKRFRYHDGDVEEIEIPSLQMKKGHGKIAFKSNPQLERKETSSEWFDCVGSRTLQDAGWKKGNFGLYKLKEKTGKVYASKKSFLLIMRDPKIKEIWTKDIEEERKRSLIDYMESDYVRYRLERKFLFQEMVRNTTIPFAGSVSRSSTGAEANQVSNKSTNDVITLNGQEQRTERKSNLNDTGSNVEREKDIPTYLGDESEFLMDAEVFEQVTTKFSSLEISMQRVGFTTTIKCKGEKAKLDEALKEIEKFVKKRISVYNASKLATEDDNLETDVILDSTVDLGFKSTRSDDGIWINTFSEDGQLQSILGKSVRCALIVKMGLMNNGVMKDVKTNNDRNKIGKQALSAFKKSGKDEDKYILARVILRKDENLEDMNVKKIKPHKNGSFVRHRQNQTPYRGKYTYKFSSKSALKVLSKFNSDRSITSQKAKKKTKGTHDSKASPEKTAKTSKISDKSAQNDYNHFCEKTRGVRDIEFGTIGGINKHSIKKYMWTVHKEKHGDSCNPDCSCVLDIGEIVKEVEKKLIEEMQSKIPNWDEIQRKGFSSDFCSKFTPSVQTEFPNDSPEQVLSKLVKMWNQGHMTNKAFGFHCNPSCNCKSAWNDLFRPICKNESTQQTKKRAKEVSKTQEVKAKKPRMHQYGQLKKHQKALQKDVAPQLEDGDQLQKLGQQDRHLPATAKEAIKNSQSNLKSVSKKKPYLGSILDKMPSNQPPQPPPSSFNYFASNMHRRLSTNPTPSIIRRYCDHKLSTPRHREKNDQHHAKRILRSKKHSSSGNKVRFDDSSIEVLEFEKDSSLHIQEIQDENIPRHHILHALFSMNLEDVMRAAKNYDQEFYHRCANLLKDEMKRNKDRIDHLEKDQTLSSSLSTEKETLKESNSNLKNKLIVIKIYLKIEGILLSTLPHLNEDDPSIKNIADPKKAKDSMKDVLRWIENIKEDALKIGIDLDIDASKINEDGESLLHVAVLLGDIDLVKILCEKNAPLRTESKTYKTPLEFAKNLQVSALQKRDFAFAEKYLEIMKILEEKQRRE
ncbi:hypothetical protein CTEN210_04495 [Chaetoceros tenuissimus]|uniref:Uncharacterized protein n=1 Tax=Chaetoceros tenuissimus TaxID=426638 RepID=A0AAD3H2Z8_9STRA|nr:hypothetical protein CTEN210_04495 [Chaetoceros tenuissimus]